MHNVVWNLNIELLDLVIQKKEGAEGVKDTSVLKQLLKKQKQVKI